MIMELTWAGSPVWVNMAAVSMIYEKDGHAVLCIDGRKLNVHESVDEVIQLWRRYGREKL